MRLLTFYDSQELKLGAKTAAGVVPISLTPEAFFQSGLEGLPVLESLVAEYSGDPLDEASLQIGPCVPAPGKILCVGLNYRRHAAESGMKEPETPVLFSKFSNAIAAHNEPVPLTIQAKEYDYEAELVAVMGKRAKNVSVEQALDCVLGYCNGNDISERKLQMLTGQWLLGKTLDKFLPVGPYLVTADEAGDPQDMRIRCWLNGELRQDSNTSDMIFSVAEVISYASHYMTLEPGDIISTGTPEGVILGMAEKSWMKPGDQVVVEVGTLGRLVNVMVAGE